MVEVWLSFNNREEVLQLPVTPFYLVSEAFNNQVVNLHTVGDVNLPGNRGLKELTIDSFFPAAGKNYYFARNPNPPPPLEAIALLEKWAHSKRPIRVIITERDINLAMMIESFSYGDQDKSGDIYFTLELKEYVFLKAPRLSTADATTAENAVSGGNTGVKTWTVKYGDTLTGIALSVYGNSERWKDIYEWNKTLVKDPHSMKAIEGKVLKLE